MTRDANWHRCAGAAVAAFLAFGGPRTAAQPISWTRASNQAGGGAAGQTRSVRDGVYSSAQAMRGRQQYEYFCGSCHLQSLEGDPGRDVPALNDERFLNNWNGRTVKELLQQISKTMPVDTPGSLTASNYVDVIAYILQVNNFPAGAQELSTGSDVLGGVLIEVNRPGISK